MGAKDKRKILVRYYAEKEVKAYSLDHARREVENMKLIKAERGITTMSYFDVFLEGLTLNIPAVMTTVFVLIYVGFLFSIFYGINDIDDVYTRLIGMVGWLILLLNTIRFPKIVDRYFRTN